MYATRARVDTPKPRLLRRAAAPEWDPLLRTCGVVALASIGVTLFAPVPQVADLATLFSLSVLINGPYSPVTPIGFEPILMAYGKLFPAAVVMAVALGAQLMVEYVNYHIYGAALQTPLLTRARESAAMRRVVRWYAAAPFMTTALVALTPMPYWAIRVTASLTRYPMRRHLAATALGRAPRLWMYAAMGALLPVSGPVILGVGFGIALVFALVTLRRHRAAARRH